MRTLISRKLREGGLLDTAAANASEAPLPEDLHPGCAELTGTWKQRKWGIDIRNKALELDWPEDTRMLLRNIMDSTWWIGNKDIVHTMKFKTPEPRQLLHESVPPENEGQLLLTDTPPADSVQKRTGDVLLWAESVSRHPLMAQAAILSCLRFAYPPGDMRDWISVKAREALAQADMAVGRDRSAIEKILAKE